MPADPLTEPLLAFTEEVEDAIAEQRPVVALESTLLTHGLPADQSDEVAQKVEAVVRSEGATPATIAIMDGRFCVGLNDDARARLMQGGAEKGSLRDLAVALASGRTYATTVAATMAIAAKAGIRLFATGGIGGVHRGAEVTYDESADLVALARHPVAVVCAGAKAVLDLPRTLERLETLGVPVLGFGTDELPAFYHGHSGLSVPATVSTPEETARIIALHTERLQSGGVLIVQPPPAAIHPERVEAMIAAALEAASGQGLRGRAVTPFLLQHLNAASEGEVVGVNIALVVQNARLAGRIASAYGRLPLM